MKSQKSNKHQNDRNNLATIALKLWAICIILGIVYMLLMPFSAAVAYGLLVLFAVVFVFLAVMVYGEIVATYKLVKKSKSKRKAKRS